MKNKFAFTLIELLVSISIIAILTVTISISFSKVQRNGRDIRRKEDMKMLQNAAEQYYLLDGNYPVNTAMPWSVDGQMILQSFPQDPKSSVYNYSAGFSNPVGIGYCFCSISENSDGNASDTGCTYLSSLDGEFFCVSNQQ